MSQVITLCLGMVILAFLIPSQVHSQSTVKSQDTNITVSHNYSSISNPSGAFPSTTSTNLSTSHSHADSLYASSALLLSIASIPLLNLCC